MARPLRIEYPNAVYHVMNRGKGRAFIFHGKAYTDLFIQSLIEAHEQFGLDVLRAISMEFIRYVGDAICNDLLQSYNNKQQAVVLGSKAFVKK